ncbi:MAG: DNA polymerase III subunit gamma/tau [Desulfobacteraceae bacterium]|nr:MAG: DNA polymerase III subunit gamma/tau [Desulfobacteraceae bacterium]
MSYLVLARKYRPLTFEQVIGQEHVTRTLINAISSDRVAHAILFSGPRGTGKTTIARILAKAMNCRERTSANPCNSCKSCKEITSGNAADVFEIDGASNNSVDQIRDLRENIKYMPQHSPYKIYIIDEVHMLSIAAFNALLKTLEEPPAHVMFLFATTEPHKIPVTILSRCQRHDLKRIRLETIIRHMAALCDKEGIAIEEESLSLIAREAGGCMRDALSLLDQILGCTTDRVDPETVPELLGITSRKNIFELSGAVLQKNIPDFLSFLDEIYIQGKDLKKVYSDLIEHFRNLLVVRMGKRETDLVNTPAHEITMMKQQVEGITEMQLSQILDTFLKEESAIRFSSQPKVAFEIAVIKMAQIAPSVPIETLIRKLDRLRTEWMNRAPGRPDDCFEKSHEQERPTTPQYTEHDKQKNKHEEKPAVPKKTTEGDKPNAILSKDPERIWEALRTVMCKDIPSLAPTLSNSVMSQISDDKIFITVKDSSFNLNRMNTKKAALAEICCSFFQKQMGLVLDMKIDTDNDRKEKMNQERRLKDEAVQHPLVMDAIEIFNGNIVDVKVLQED